MTIWLHTPLPDLAPELFDVVRLFYGSVPCQLEGEAPLDAAPLFHTLSALEGKWVCRFQFQGKQALMEAPVPWDADGRRDRLIKKRALKRLVKQTLYALMKEVTGLHPPWGSLTGIRPTRLYYELKAQGLSDSEAEKRLRDQYDLIAEKAALLREIAGVQGALPPPDPKKADIYIGIPFCTTRCAYCSFLSGEMGDGHLVPPYLDALTAEMEAVSRLMKETGLALRAVYMGGGTPTSLTAEQLGRVLAAVIRFFPGAEEFTVEAGRPDTITGEKLARIRDAGAGRISINPQTMSDETLRRIGRAHTAKDSMDAYDLARRAGFRHINMDVIAGLPGEELADFARTMEGALALRPESLTVHTLAIKRSSRLHLEEFPLPDGDAAAAMVLLGGDTARKMGMVPYYVYRQKYMAGNQENVGYALPGHACLYNVDIMEETTHILAVGAGAISKRIVENEGRIERAPNVSNIEQYTARIGEMIQRKRSLWQI